MTIHRVKATFKDEPGEGSGVARSFYTAVGEAFLSGEKLPSLDTSRSKLTTHTNTHCSNYNWRKARSGLFRRKSSSKAGFHQAGSTSDIRTRRIPSREQLSSMFNKIVDETVRSAKLLPIVLRWPWSKLSSFTLERH